jgi:hypothetical protein
MAQNIFEFQIEHFMMEMIRIVTLIQQGQWEEEV